MCVCGREEKLLWKIQLLRRKLLKQSPSVSAGASSRLCIARAAPELLLWFLWFVRSLRYLSFTLGWSRWGHWSHSLQTPVCSELPEMRKAKLVLCRYSLPTSVSSLAVPAPLTWILCTDWTHLFAFQSAPGKMLAVGSYLVKGERDKHQERWNPSRFRLQIPE